jgi:hypothetical protein
MAFLACLLSAQSVACFAGGVITGFPCEAQNENSDIGLDSHIERSSVALIAVI